MASNHTSPPRRKRTASENDSDNEFDEIETLCEEVVELYKIEKKAEEARRAETGQTGAASESETEAERAQRAGTGEASSSDQSVTGSESDYKISLTRFTEDFFLHRQRAARHGRVDRLEKLVELLASLPKEVEESIALINIGDPEELLVPFEPLVEAAVNGCVEPVRFLCRNAQFKNTEIKQAAIMAFLFRRTDVIAAFAELGMIMDEDVFLADVLALKNAPVTEVTHCGTSPSCTAAQEACGHLVLLKAALRGDQTQVAHCLDEVRSAGAEEACCRSENEDENVNWMECHRRVFCNDRLAPTKKDAFINIAILITIARGYHQALRVLLDQAGPAWKNVTMLSQPLSIVQFDTSPMNLAVLSGCAHIVQVLLDQVQGESVSAIPGFLFNAMMHERLDIVLHLVKQAKALVNGAGDVDRDLHCPLIKAIPYTLFTAIERRSRLVVKLIFEEFKRGELLLDDSEDGELDKFVQDSKSLPILRGFVLWCPDYVKNQLQIEPKLAEVWPVGYRCLLDAKGKVENRSDIPEGSDSEDELELG